MDRENQDVKYMTQYNTSHKRVVRRDYHTEARRILLSGDLAEGQVDRMAQNILCCPRCKSDQVSYYLYAARSGDEGMVSRCLCQTCKHRFQLN